MLNRWLARVQEGVDGGDWGGGIWNKIKMDRLPGIIDYQEGGKGYFVLWVAN